MAEVQRESIESAFSMKRGTDLPFAPRPRAAQTTRADDNPPPVTTNAPEPSSADDESPHRNATRKTRTTSQKTRKESAVERQVSTYVPPELRERLQIARPTTGLSYEGMLIYVADHFLESVPEYLKSLPGHNLAPEGAMPRRTSTSRRPRGRHVDGFLVIQFRLSEAQITFLDGLVKKFNAVSRSALVEAMLTCFADNASSVARTVD